MKRLFKSSHWITLLAVEFLMLGCHDKMTYEMFLSRFQQQCSSYYLLRSLTEQEKITVCDCMLKTTKKNYPNMAALLNGIRVHDREPRGEGDFVPSAIRMAAATCIK